MKPAANPKPAVRPAPAHEVARPRLSRRWLVLGAGALLAMTVLVYLPVWGGGFIWDDDVHVTANPTLSSWDGLRRIWCEFGVVPQYYPLVHTTFWIEHRLWGLAPLGYHLNNVLLHALNAMLLWWVLQRLRVPGAWLAAAIFAVHPVHVESVAWISERKNVLSTAFYLAAMLAYFKFSPWETGTDGRHRPRWGWYAVAVALFGCALLSKTVTCSLPAVLVLVLWWKQGSLRGRDAAALVPMFLLGVVAANLTVQMEKRFVGAVGEEWSLSGLERLLVAGRALWFYVGKLFWPVELTFIYPRWRVDAGAWWQYLFPLAAAGVFIGLWRARGRIGRAPVVLAAIFAGTLLPALGFFNLYPMRYSYVADHFQYLASIAVIAGVAALVARGWQRAGPWGRRVTIATCGAVLGVSGVLAWQQTKVYAGPETLWNDTIAKDPGSWMAHYNLGLVLQGKGQLPAAIEEYVAAIRVKPDHAKARTNLGSTLHLQGRFEEAIVQYRAAVQLQPQLWIAHYNLGLSLVARGQMDEAITAYRTASQLNPNHPDIHLSLAGALARQQRFGQAIQEYRWALRLNPRLEQAHLGIGMALLAQGQTAEAVAELERALQVKPGYVAAQTALETARGQTATTVVPVEEEPLFSSEP